MASSAIRSLLATGRVWQGHAPATPAPAAGWGLGALGGRLVELEGGPASAALTAAVGLVLDAQRRREPVAWLTRPALPLYPPDVAAAGVDLDALVVVRLDDVAGLLRAADRLLRSGAFGLVVLDLGDLQNGSPGRSSGAYLPLAVQVRLAGLAKRHDAALVVLQCGRREAGRREAGRQLVGRGRGAGPGGPGMPAQAGSLSSLRARVGRERVDDGRFLCRVHVVKDKRRGSEWDCEQVLRGPMGLR